MPADNASAWDQHAAHYQQHAGLTTDTAHYGPDIADETELRLLGALRAKRVLELGCGAAQCSISFAKQGATAIGVDASAEQLAIARDLAKREEVAIELHHGDLADLAFIRSATIDATFSSYAFGFVEDLNRVFRQVHRVLKNGCPLVFSMPHPTYALLDDDAEDPFVVRRSYWDRTPVDYESDGVGFTDFPHTMSDIFAGLARANFRVDALLEPEPVPGGDRSWFWREPMRLVPRTLVIRARKEGD